MGRISTFGQHLYEGRISFDFVGRRKLFYAISVAIVVIAALAFVFRGFNYGVEFKGGVEFTATVKTANSATSDKLVEAIEDAKVPEAGDPTVQTSGENRIRIQTRTLSQDEATTVTKALEKAGATEVSQNLIGPTYGKQVATKSLTGLLVFLVIVVLFIWLTSASADVGRGHRRADPRLGHHGRRLCFVRIRGHPRDGDGTADDFGLLSIRHRRGLRQGAREHQGHLGVQHEDLLRASQLGPQPDARAVDQHSDHRTSARRALLFAGIAILGTGPLKDLALALFVGMLAGTYSSIFLATPLAVQLKEREPAIKAQTARVLARRAKEASEPVAAASVPTAARPVRSTGAAKRAQPTRKPRSQRGKGGS